MQVTREKKQDSQIVYSVQIPESDVNQVFNRAFRRVARDVQVPGFRKGKVPRRIFEQRYGSDALEAEARKEAYALAYEQVMKEENVRPLTWPRFEAVEFSEHEPATIKLTVAVKPEFDLPTYKNLKVKAKKVDVSKEEVDEQIRRLQMQRAEFVPLLENRGAQEGDWLALQITAEANSDPQSMWYKLGSKQLPPEFHQGLAGASIGEKRVVEANVSADESAGEAGGKVKADVEVKDIRKEKLPELDRAFAQQLQCTDMTELRQKVHSELERVKQRREEQRIRGELISKVSKSVKVDLPEMVVEETAAEKMQKLEQELQQQNRTMASYLEEQNADEKKLRRALRAQAEAELKALFVLDKIAEDEEIIVTQEEVDKRLEQMARGPDKKQQAQQLKQELDRKEQLSGLMQRMRNEKTMDFIYSKANISGGSIMQASS